MELYSNPFFSVNVIFSQYNQFYQQSFDEQNQDQVFSGNREVLGIYNYWCLQQQNNESEFQEYENNFYFENKDHQHIPQQPKDKQNSITQLNNNEDISQKQNQVNENKVEDQQSDDLNENNDIPKENQKKSKQTLSNYKRTFERGFERIFILQFEIMIQIIKIYRLPTNQFKEKIIVNNYEQAGISLERILQFVEFLKNRDNNFVNKNCLKIINQFLFQLWVVEGNYDEKLDQLVETVEQKQESYMNGRQQTAESQLLKNKAFNQVYFYLQYQMKNRNIFDCFEKKDILKNLEKIINNLEEKAKLKNIELDNKRMIYNKREEEFQINKQQEEQQKSVQITSYKKIKLNNKSQEKLLQE